MLKDSFDYSHIDYFLDDLIIAVPGANHFLDCDFSNNIFEIGDISTSVYSPLVSKKRIEFYPNPTSNSLHISTAKELNYSIYSLDGRSLKTGITLDQIDVSSLQSGLYLLFIDNQMQKFIKQ